MDLLTRIQTYFANSITPQQRVLSSAGAAIAQAAERIAHCLAYQGKVLVCGDGSLEVQFLIIHCLCDLIEHLVCAEENQR